MKRRVSKYAFPIFIIIILLALSFQTMISIDDEMIIDECMLFEESNCEHQKFLVNTLDDRKHLQSWWNNRDLFLEHDLTLTMFIDRTSGLNETEWGWLKQFQTDGHEIGVHGSNHSSVTDFLEREATVHHILRLKSILKLRGLMHKGFTLLHLLILMAIELAKSMRNC